MAQGPANYSVLYTQNERKNRTHTERRPNNETSTRKPREYQVYNRVSDGERESNFVHWLPLSLCSRLGPENVAREPKPPMAVVRGAPPSSPHRAKPSKRHRIDRLRSMAQKRPRNRVPNKIHYLPIENKNGFEKFLPIQLNLPPKAETCCAVYNLRNITLINAGRKKEERESNAISSRASSSTAGVLKPSRVSTRWRPCMTDRSQKPAPKLFYEKASKVKKGSFFRSFFAPDSAVRRSAASVPLCPPWVVSTEY